MSLFKCTVCNYIYEGEVALEKCPMCGAPKDKHDQLDEAAADKIINADFTNGLHADIIGLASNIVALCQEGIEEELDPMCVNIFNKSKDLAWEIKQMSKAEVENHVKKSKW
jgi:rubredoxin